MEFSISTEGFPPPVKDSERMPVVGCIAREGSGPGGIRTRGLSEFRPWLANRSPVWATVLRGCPSYQAEPPAHRRQSPVLTWNGAGWRTAPALS